MAEGMQVRELVSPQSLLYVFHTEKAIEGLGFKERQLLNKTASYFRGTEVKLNPFSKEDCLLAGKMIDDLNSRKTTSTPESGKAVRKTASTSEIEMVSRPSSTEGKPGVSQTASKTNCVVAFFLKLFGFGTKQLSEEVQEVRSQMLQVDARLNL